ncbi:MAG: hypothetical protein HY960_13810 [Ignavibacteriae bacterium]|nr:hypothetical protein [Ignavibacteriota bacterium]
MTNDEITKAILGYLLKHPDAGDTLEGIAEWWITQEMVEMRKEQITETIQELCKEGLLVEKDLGNERKIYFYNKQR